jgi:hypothetical protein
VWSKPYGEQKVTNPYLDFWSEACVIAPDEFCLQKEAKKQHLRVVAYLLIQISFDGAVWTLIVSILKVTVLNKIHLVQE